MKSLSRSSLLVNLLVIVILNTHNQLQNFPIVDVVVCNKLFELDMSCNALAMRTDECFLNRFVYILTIVAYLLRALKVRLLWIADHVDQLVTHYLKPVMV